jgi:hypothetical protein
VVANPEQGSSVGSGLSWSSSSVNKSNCAECRAYDRNINRLSNACPTHRSVMSSETLAQIPTSLIIHESKHGRSEHFPIHRRPSD